METHEVLAPAQQTAPLILTPQQAGRVLLAFDTENFFNGLTSRFEAGERNIEKRIKALMSWVESMGGLLGGHGFIFSPEHLTSPQHEMFNRNGSWFFITCYKKILGQAELNPKTQKMETVVDTVNQTIADYAMTMTRHKDFQTFCLVSGDGDFIPLMEELRRCGIKTAIAAPSINCLSRNLINHINFNPETGKKLILMLDEV